MSSVDDLRKAVWMTYVRLPVCVDDFFIFQQHLDGLNKLDINGMKQRVLRVDAHDHQRLDHLQVLIVDGHVQSSSPQRVDTVAVHVARAASALLQHSEQTHTGIEPLR